MLALTYCLDKLRGGQEGPNSRRKGPCWHYVGSFFALGRLLGHFLLVLGAFSSLHGFLIAFRDAPGSILEAPGVSRRPPGRVLEAPRPYFSTFFRARELASACASQNLRMCKKPVFTRFLLGFYMTHMLHKWQKPDKKSVPGLCEWTFAQRSCKHCV